MDSQMFQCIEAQGDPEAQTRALAYFDSLKNSEFGYQVCMTLLTNGNVYDDNVKFFCLKVIEHYVKEQYEKSGKTQEYNYLKKFLARFIQVQYQRSLSRPDSIPVRNKVAQIYAMVFLIEYPNRWSSFLSDLIDSLVIGPKAVDHYLRVLKAINLEIVEQGYNLKSDDVQRNRAIKDKMRKVDIQNLALSWYHIMLEFSSKEPKIVALCLEVISDYTDWIDVAIVTNAAFLQAILKECSNTETRLQAIDFFSALVRKGMQPEAKYELIESLVQILMPGGIFMHIGGYEKEFKIKVGALVNKIGMNLINCATEMNKKQIPINFRNIEFAIKDKLPSALTFFKDSDDEVSATVIDFIKQFLRLLKNKQFLTDVDVQCFNNVFEIVSEKMKMKENYNFENEDDLEANFRDYRKQLGSIFRSLGNINIELLTQNVRRVLSPVFVTKNWSEESFIIPECAIKLLKLLGDSLNLTSYDNCFVNVGISHELTALKYMINELVTCNINTHPHPAVLLQYFETVVRYYQFFSIYSDKIPPVLIAFLDNRGMKHQSKKLRSLCALQFANFVKCLKSEMSGYAFGMLKLLKELKVIPSSECPQEEIAQEDQLNIYEAAGILIAQGYFDTNDKKYLLAELLIPAHNAFANITARMVVESDLEGNKELMDILRHSVALTTATTKAFRDLESLEFCDCVQIYINALEIFIKFLGVARSETNVHDAIRQLMHHMVLCLGDKLIPYLPIVTRGLRSTANADCVVDNTSLLVQIINQYNKKITSLFQQDFIEIGSNILSTSNAEMTNENDNHSRVQQRCYLTFLVSLLNNGMFLDVLNAQDDFCVKQIINQLVHGCVDDSDVTVQRQCYSILSKFVDEWSNLGNDEPKGFIHCLYNLIIPTFFKTPLKPNFVISDPNCERIMAQCITILKTVHSIRGNELIKYLDSNIFPSLHLPPVKKQEFYNALNQNDHSFRSFMKKFFVQERSHIYLLS